MATFNPYNRAIKESINVDFKDRHSPQKVILCNRENQFYGEFIGTIKGYDVDIVGGKITGVALSNVSIYDAAGKLWHLSSLSQQLADVNASIDIISGDTIPALSVQISANSEKIEELSNALKDVFQFAENISANLNAERLERGRVDDFLNNKIDSVYSSLSGVDYKLSSNLIDHIRQQKKDLTVLSTDILDRFNILKHYSIVYPSLTKEQYLKGYQLSDYSSNIIAEEVPYGYVKIHLNSTDSQEEDKFVGKIHDVQFEGGDVTKFTFVVFEGCPFLELKPGKYEFSRSEYIHPTNYLNYTIRWGWNEDPSDPFRMILEGSEPLKYLQSTTVDADTATKPAGRIVDFLSDDTIDNIISGVIKFDTSLTETLSGFNDIVFSFNGDGDSKVFECSDGVNRKVIFDQSNKKFILRDNYYVEFYQSLKNLSNEFARIYEGDVTYVPSESGVDVLDSVAVRLSADVQGTVIHDTFTLNTDNSFKKFIDEKFNYLEFDGTNLSVNHQSITYKATLKDFDRSNGTVLSNIVVGDITFGIENITDISDHRISCFNLSIPNGVLSGDYKLEQSNFTESKNIYAYEKSLDGEYSLRFEYDSKYGRNLIKYIHKTEKTVIGYFFIDMSTLRAAKDETYSIYQTAVLIDDGTGKILFPEEDAKETVNYNVNYSTDVKTEGEQKEYVLNSFTGTPEINITIPNNTVGGRLREFIVVFKTQSPYKDKFTKINVLHEDDSGLTIEDYKFFMDGFDVTKRLFIVRNTAVLKFTEINTNKFVIEDMNNANLIHYFNERLRGGVNYRGVVRVVFQSDGKTEHLSNLFYFPDTQKPSGWDYPRPEYKNSSIPLFNGNMFFVGKTAGTTTTRWTIDGLELEYGDYIIINKDDVKICDITSSDIDVIDTIEKDKIIVDDIQVNNKADISNLVVVNVSSDNIQNSGDIKSSTISATSISSDTADFRDVKSDYLNFISANGTELTSTSATISILDAIDGTISNITATNEIVEKISANSETVDALSATNEFVSSLTVLNEIAQSVSAQNEIVENLSVDSEIAQKLSATDVSVDNEVASSLTAESLYSTNATAVSAKIGDLSVGVERVDEITAASLTSNSAYITGLSSTNAQISAVQISNLTVETETASQISAGKISVELSNLIFNNNGDVSSASDISAQFRKEIDFIDKRILGVVTYKGDAKIIDVPGAPTYTTQFLSNLIWINADDRHDHPSWNFPYPECSNPEHELSVGEMFYVGKTDDTDSTRWVLSDGVETVELEEGDYIFIKDGPVKINQLRVSNIHVIDSIEKDHIIVDNLDVLSVANINRLSANDVSIGGTLDVDSEVVKALSVNVETVTTLCVTTEIVENVSSDNLKFNNASGEMLSSVSAIFNTVSTENEYTNRLTVNNEVAEMLSSNKATINELCVESEQANYLSSDKMVFNNSYGNNLSSTSISSTTISAYLISSENVKSDKGEFNHLTGVNLCSQNETVCYLSVLSSEYANKIDSDEISSKNANVDSLFVKNAMISSLSASTGVVSTLTADSVSATTISSDLNKVTFVNGDEISTAFEISVNLQNQITDNTDDISTLSSDLSSLSCDHEDLQFRYKKTFLSSDVASDYPNYLVLRDLVKPQNVYVLTIRDGMLATKLIKTIHG